MKIDIFKWFSPLPSTQCKGAKIDCKSMETLFLKWCMQSISFNCNNFVYIVTCRALKIILLMLKTKCWNDLVFLFGKVTISIK